jgi:hypothetical protein
VVQLLPKGNSKLISANVLDNPFPDLLEALQRQYNAGQLLLHPLEDKVVCMSQIQQIGRVLEQLDLFGGHRHLNNVSCGDWSIASMKEPLLDES